VQAIEFAAQIQNGRIELPAQFQSWMNVQPVRVIVLLDQAYTASIVPQQQAVGCINAVSCTKVFKFTKVYDALLIRPTSFILFFVPLHLYFLSESEFSE